MYVSAISMRLPGGTSTPALRAMFQPCFCLCLGLAQMMSLTPRRLIGLHFSQRGLMLACTFIGNTSQLGQDLWPVLGKGHGVLEMGGPLAVLGDDGPIVLEDP